MNSLTNAQLIAGDPGWLIVIKAVIRVNWSIEWHV